MSLKFWKKPDEQPKEQAKKTEQQTKTEKPNISEKVDLQLTAQPSSSLNKAATAAVMKERELKAGELVKQLKPLQLSMLKGLAAIRKKGPKALTNQSFKGDLALGDVVDIVHTAEVNLTSMAYMEGQLLARLAKGKKQDVVDKYQNGIAGLNASINKMFSTRLEEKPDKISMH